uniref:Uncharacterized protein n=1 Tax=Bionectria ochroleuca TaxID=29856 RepID=A0A8H7NP31_BIOOC
MSHPYFSHASLGLSLIPTFFGLNMLFRPGPTLESVKFPVPADPEGKKTAHSVMHFLGARNIAVSYLLVLIWSRGTAGSLPSPSSPASGSPAWTASSSARGPGRANGRTGASSPSWVVWQQV